ncbi:E3 ubiquitin-protein ligase RFI2-like isoform X2 [Capsella rubella]|uniref:E3 ubiquitin-protein ligase RFI2-like isoform X2 n=1 Tax=Capsella rubella TaxID=81985 RepID=UPI000CD53E69|nr:E3 ubiquitin-protein ligase RFI2-like isoform X2 [Capsella rubella]
MNMGDGTNVNKNNKRVAFENKHFDDDDECMICFESLADDRTPVKLRCGHHYHLHCIGSAFNAINMMQCPTCKRVEQSEWLFARRSDPSRESRVPMVQPLMGLTGLPVRRRLVFPSLGRQLDQVNEAVEKVEAAAMVEEAVQMGW